MIVEFIDTYRHRFRVEPICAVLTEYGIPIAPSTYYARKACPVSEADVADAYAANVVLDVYRAHRGVYGADKLWHALRGAGHPIGRDQVARLMRIPGIQGIRRGRHTHYNRAWYGRRPAPRPAGSAVEDGEPAGPVVGSGFHLMGEPPAFAGHRWRLAGTTEISPVQALVQGVGEPLRGDHFMIHRAVEA